MQNVETQHVCFRPVKNFHLDTKRRDFARYPKTFTKLRGYAAKSHVEDIQPYSSSVFFSSHWVCLLLFKKNIPKRLVQICALGCLGISILANYCAFQTSEVFSPRVVVSHLTSRNSKYQTGSFNFLQLAYFCVSSKVWQISQPGV